MSSPVTAHPLSEESVVDQPLIESLRRSREAGGCEQHERGRWKPREEHPDHPKADEEESKHEPERTLERAARDHDVLVGVCI